MEDVFEQRWRKAYEVRALERESREGHSQVRRGRRRCSGSRMQPACQVAAARPC